MALTAVALLASCSQQPAPSYEDMITFFVKNAQSFDELRQYYCEVADEKDLSRYAISDEYTKSSPRIDKLDSLIAKVNGRVVHYVATNDGECIFNIEIYRKRFVNAGFEYYYSYNLQEPDLYDESKHSKEKISESRDDAHFDMLLSYDKDGKAWYFTHTSY